MRDFKIVVTDEEYQLLIRKWVMADFAANDFFDKYEELLPHNILEKEWVKRVNLSKKYYKIVEKSIRISDIFKWIIGKF